MTRIISYLLIALILVPHAVIAELRIGSWNIQNLGWGDDTNYEALAAVAQHFDLLAIQEVMDAAALDRLEGVLEETTGEPWKALVSRPLGPGNYQEHYALLYRDAHVTYLEGASVYPDPHDVFVREPLSARFRSERTGNTFAIATVHILYGDSIDDRLPEIRALDRYWRWLEETYQEDAEAGRLLLVGDFNLPPEHDGFDGLRDDTRALVTDGATTLSSVDDRYANLYDNIFVSTPTGFTISNSGIVRYPELLDWDHETARAYATDHAPVYLTLGGAELDLDPAAVEAEPCIDLNAAPPAALESLPHIGPARAEAIAEGRPWEHPQELTRIDGLGEQRVGEIAASSEVCEG